MIGDDVEKFTCFSSCLTLSDIKNLSKLTIAYNINSDDNEIFIDHEKLRKL